MNIASFLVRTAQTYPDRSAVALGDRTWIDYGALMRRVAVMAFAFRNSLRLVPGDCVAMALGNCPQYVEIWYAAWYAGLIVVPMNAKLHPRECEYILQNSVAKVCFASGDLAQSLEALRANVPALERVIEVGSAEYETLYSADAMPHMSDAKADDVAWLFYTSGTTGRPKGVMITHRNILSMSLAYFAAVDSIAPTDCILHAAPAVITFPTCWLAPAR